MKVLTLIFLLCFYSHNYSQRKNDKPLTIKYELGLSFESSVLLNTKKYTNIENEDSFTDIYPLSFYLSSCVYLANNFTFEFRPGVVLGGEYYSGFEYGFYLRYYFMGNKYYTSIGLNIHDNFETGHGTAVSVWATDETVNLLGLKIAYKPKLNFAFTLSYYYPLKNYPYYSISNSDEDSYITTLNHIVKLGLELTF